MTISDNEIYLIVAIIVLAFSVLAWTNWRTGILLTIVIAAIQDPARKLVSEQPVFFVVLSAIVFFVSTISYLANKNSLSPSVIQGSSLYLKNPLLLYIVVVLLQVTHSYITYQSMVISGIGLLSYLSPIPAIILGNQFAKNLQALDKLHKIILGVGVMGGIGIFLQFSGVNWQIFDDIGSGITIYKQGGILKDYCGIFRSSEVAAWYMATTFCVSVIIIVSNAHKGSTFTFVAIALLVLAAGFLTGRRKIIFEMVIFLISYVVLLYIFRKGAKKIAGITISGLIIAVIVLYQYESLFVTLGDYYQHSLNATDLVERRVEDLGIGSMISSWEAFGIWGLGAGIGSQGAQHFGGGAKLVGGASEFGLGKIMMELGLPGLVCVVWLVVSSIKHILLLMKKVATEDDQVSRYLYGVISFLISNLAGFFIATQIYGDVTVLIIIGLHLGIALAVPEIVAIRKKNEAEKIT